MIVPHSRLLFWTALVAPPFALLGAMVPEAEPLAALMVALLCAVGALDAVLSRGRLAGLRVSLAGPARLTQSRDGVLALQFTNDGRKPLRLRLGLGLPPEIESKDETLTLALPAGARLSRLAWPVRGMRRGIYRVSHCAVERRSPLGLWLVRAALPLEGGGEVRVYPNLLPERKALAAFFLPRGALGVRRQRQVGQGREFEKLRDYIPGDSMSEIHWKATAKRRRPITKLYQIERTQEVYVVLDASRLSARPARVAENGGPASNPNVNINPNENGLGEDAGATILDRFLTAALVTALAAERQGDRFGLITFSDKVRGFIPAGGGKAHYNVCRDALVSLQPRLVTPDYDELFTTLRLRLRRRALLIFLTSLDDPTLAESFQRRLGLVCRHHLVLAGMLAPRHARELFSAGAAPGEPALLNERLAGHILWHELRKLDKSLERRGVQFAQFSHERMVAELVTRYLQIKQRQLL